MNIPPNAPVTEVGIVYDVLVGESKYTIIAVIAALNNTPSALANVVFDGSTLINPLYPLNALLAKLVTEAGIVKLVKLVQLVNVELPIVVIEFGKIILSSSLQPVNTPPPILVTELGIVIFVKLEQL
jgi:hypothetical protein